MTAKVIHPDTAIATRILAATATTVEIMIRDGGMYMLAVLNLPEAGTIKIEAKVGATWVEADKITKDDLRAAGANYSGVATARLATGNWRISVSAAGPVIYIGAAGEG